MWNNYFETPFINGLSVYIYDFNFNPICNFLELSKNSTDNIVNALNGDFISQRKYVFALSDDKSRVLMDGVPILLIHGWGYLTGSCKLSPEKAIEVQNSLAEFICKQLNKSCKQ